MRTGGYQPIVEVTRGGIVESLHYGAIAVVDARGRLIASWGDPMAYAFLRSSSKPMQVLPLIEGGGVERFQLSDKEIAVMCASHAGTEDHVETVLGIQARLGLKESELLCGVHPPSDKASAEALKVSSREPGAVHNNCSGKHTGFLAQAVLGGYEHADYINPRHPVQQQILRTFADMCQFSEENIITGTDGCSAPVFALPLYNAAWGFARLADPFALTTERAKACRTITSAMMAHPFMVAGPGRFDTLVMQSTAGKIATKGGAEGYQAIAVMPDALAPGSPALGICYKTSDGDAAHRSGALIGLTILTQLGLISRQDLEGSLAKLGQTGIQNWAGVRVGELRPAFSLDWTALREWMPG